MEAAAISHPAHRSSSRRRCGQRAASELPKRVSYHSSETNRRSIQQPFERSPTPRFSFAALLTRSPSRTSTPASRTLGRQGRNTRSGANGCTRHREGPITQGAESPEPLGARRGKNGRGRCIGYAPRNQGSMLDGWGSPAEVSLMP